MAIQSEKDKVKHILRRFGLGASQADLDKYGRNGAKMAVETLLGDLTIKDAYSLDAVVYRNRTNNNFNTRQAQYHVYAKLIATSRPLEAKMALFWHDHFAISAEKVTNAYLMADHWDLLCKHATSRLEDILTATSKDPAMIFWLDNQQNVKGRPNENFAREVMELFTLGIGHYTEKDIQEAARAFTGWTAGFTRNNATQTIRNGVPPRGSFFYFDARNHDTGEKEVLGNKGPFKGEDILGLLAGHPRTAEYIAWKAWEWFVYPNPEKQVIDRVAAEYRANGLDTKALIRAITNSPEFFSERAHRALVKNPIDYVIPTLRQLGVGEFFLKNFDPNKDQSQSGAAMNPVGLAIIATQSMGMELLMPPDVDGWTKGSGWISTATIVERMKWADKLFGGPAGGRSMRAPAWPMIQTNPTPEGVVGLMNQIFDVDVPMEKRKQLADAARNAAGGPINQRNANRVAHRVTQALFASPEFQFM
ncbi:DUF1800 domain-containing protein [Geitlerinema splendidum]|nr:DUF1800 domain-containing protein [Geitlerinema splendidum]